MNKIYLIILLSIFSCKASGMEFRQLGGTFTMDGNIEEGDSIDFIASLASWKTPPTVFHISSKGGNLDEAMKIGKIIRLSQIPVWTGEECFSACVFIYAAGVERDARGNIGLHRPSFEKKYFANLTSLEAKDKYNELKQQSISYLKELEVSQAIIDRMFQTGSTEVELINATDANKLFGIKSPFYDEWLTAKCGKYTAEQSQIIMSWYSLQAVRMTVAVMQDDSFPKTDDFGSNIIELLDNAQLALQMENADTLAPYIELSEIYQKCQEKAVSSHRYSFHRSLQNYLLELRQKATQ